MFGVKGHVHKTKYRNCDITERYEVCECGAVRIIKPNGDVGEWQVCWRDPNGK